MLLTEAVRFVRKLPENITFRVGQPLTLAIAYTGIPRVYVSWKKDGKPIWASYKYNVKTSDCSCVLEVLNSDREEAKGRYTCEISNAQGSDICHAYVQLGNTNPQHTACSSVIIHSAHEMTLVPLVELLHPFLFSTNMVLMVNLTF